ncbi:hypothetical protein [Paracraurococcus lichenis]|uniref:Uncharacterized protein n=1 Tax=Paracraurococcus lichenis TaxID=3064888 RepID=A0ABT9DV51_9PROT|nr:hypothetical protein [Paracraurococcus sp. LOR1-02]MDO9707779.1 hypothetical protein [Paracraurococcus sp. LOR1-02]
MTVHDAAGARVALSLAGPRGVLLLSAPGAAGYLGPAWFLAVVASARTAHPGILHIAVLDCVDAPGQALAALRAGLREVVLDPACPGFGQVAGAAAEIGARVRPARPPSLDLGPLDLAKPGARAKVVAWLAAAG